MRITCVVLRCLNIPEGNLTNPRRFVLEIASDGFNAYKQGPDGEFELISASPKAVGSDRRTWEENILLSLIKAMVAVNNAVTEVTCIRKTP